MLHFCGAHFEIIEGTPNSEGTYDFSVRATNSAGTNTQSYTMNIMRDTSALADIKNRKMPDSCVGSDYSNVPHSTMQVSNFSGVTLYTTSGSGTITVSHPNHGLSTGSNVYFYIGETVNGIPESNLNSKKTITVANANSYTITTSTIATATGSYGPISGKPAVEWSVVSDSDPYKILPSGLSLSNTGVVTGIVAGSVGEYYLKVRATNGSIVAESQVATKVTPYPSRTLTPLMSPTITIYQGNGT